jgi:hypothetical protein
MEGLALLSTEQPPRDLPDQIVIRTLGQRRRRFLVRRFQLTAAVAASVVLALVAVGRRPQLTSPLANDQPETPALARVLSLDAGVREAGSAVVGLVERTTRETLEDTRSVLPWRLTRHEPPAGQMVQAMIDPPARSLKEVGDGVAAGLSPVTDSARRAVDLFLSELPPTQ